MRFISSVTITALSVISLQRLMLQHALEYAFSVSVLLLEEVTYGLGLSTLVVSPVHAFGHSLWWLGSLV